MAHLAQQLPTQETVNHPQAMGYSALLDNVYLRILNNQDSPTQIQFAPLEPPRVQTDADPEDAGAPEFGAKFARSDFTGGEGLDFAHRVQNPDNYRTRFWDSKGMDVFVPNPGEQRRIRLNNKVEQLLSLPSNLVDIAHFDDKLFSTNGTDVEVLTNPLSSNPTSTTEDTGSDIDIHSLVTFGDHLYAACGSDGIRRRDTSGTWSSWSDQDASKVWAEKNRILVADNEAGELYEAEAADGSTLLATLPGGHTWNDVTDIGEGIAAAASDGSIWVFTISDDGTLQVGTQIPLYSDIPVSVLGYRGLVFYHTQIKTETGFISRFWTGVFQQGTLVNIQLQRQWGTRSDPLTHTSAAIEPHHGKVYIGVPEHDGTYIWKYDLTTGGRVRDIGSEDPDFIGSVRKILSIGNRLFYSIDNKGVFREGDEYVDSGYMILPLIDFFDPRQKTWASIDADFDPAQLGEQIDIFYSTNPAAINDPEHSSWRQIIQIGEFTPTLPVRFRQLSSRYLTIMVKMKQGEDTTPNLRAISVVAYPSETDLLIRVPVNVSDRIERPGRRAVIARGLGNEIHNYLHTKHGQSVLFRLFRPKENIVGTITDISEVVPYSNKISGAVTYISTVTIRGRRVPEIGPTFNDDTIGIGVMGIVGIGGNINV